MSRFYKILQLSIYLISFIFGGNSLKAQEVSAKLDSFQIEIGEQVYFYLSVKQNKNEFVKFPDFKDNIIDGIDIIEKSIIDTTELADGKLSLMQSFLITSFDDSLYNIPSFPFVSISNGTIRFGKRSRYSLIRSLENFRI